MRGCTSISFVSRSTLLFAAAEPLRSCRSHAHLFKVETKDARDSTLSYQSSSSGALLDRIGSSSSSPSALAACSEISATRCTGRPSCRATHGEQASQMSFGFLTFRQHWSGDLDAMRTESALLRRLQDEIFGPTFDRVLALATVAGACDTVGETSFSTDKTSKTAKTYKAADLPAEGRLAREDKSCRPSIRRR